MKPTKTTKKGTTPITTEFIEVKSVSPEEALEDTQDSTNGNQIVIEVLPYRVRRMDTNNIVIERLKKRVTSDDTYWEIEGYYSNVVSAVTKLFYKVINQEDIKSIEELMLLVSATESRIKDSIKNLKM